MAKTGTKQKILFLDTQLDKKLTSQRTQIDFMKAFFKNYDCIETISKEVHSRSDLSKFLDYARKDKSVTVVHIVGHGESSPKRCLLILTMDELIDLSKPEGQKLFRGLADGFFFSHVAILAVKSK